MIPPAPIVGAAEDIPVTDGEQVTCRAAVAEWIEFNEYQPSARAVAKICQRMLAGVGTKNVVFRAPVARHRDDDLHRVGAIVNNERRDRVDELYNLIPVECPH
jgi:hypothetical protein